MWFKEFGVKNLSRLSSGDAELRALVRSASIGLGLILETDSSAATVAPRTGVGRMRLLRADVASCREGNLVVTASASGIDMSPALEFRTWCLQLVPQAKLNLINLIKIDRSLTGAWPRTSIASGTCRCFEFWMPQQGKPKTEL